MRVADADRPAHPDAEGDGDVGVLRRPALTRQLLSAGAGAAVAAGGFGKSTLLDQAAHDAGAPVLDVVTARDCDAATLVWLLARAARRRGAAGLAGALAAAAAAEPVDAVAVADLLAAAAEAGGLTVVVDEIGELVEPDALALVATLAARAAAATEPGEPGLRVLVAGRTLPDVLDPAFAVRLDEASLALSPEEVATLVRSRFGETATATATATEVWAHSQGWPAGVAVALARADGVADSADGGADRADRADRADSRAHSATGADGPGAGQAPLEVVVRGPGSRTTLTLPHPLATVVALPLLSPELVVALAGPRAWTDLAEAGVPTRERGDGWWVVPDPVRDAALAAGATTGATTARAAAGLYADGGLVPEAVALLLRHGDTVAIADLLASLDWTALDGLSGGELRAVQEVIDDHAAAAHPRALLHLAWAAEHQAEATLVARCLDRLEAAIPLEVSRRPGTEPDLERLALLLRAEQARAAVRLADLDRAMDLAAQVRAATTSVGADPDLATARGRATYALAIALLYDVTPERLRQGDALLTEAAGLLRLSGVPRWESQAWLGLGYGVDLNAGRFGRGAERIARGLALLPQQDAARARLLTFLVEVLTHLPRLDEAEAAGLEAAAIAERFADRHLSAYAHWSLAWVSARRRDLPRVRARLERVELDLADWYDLPAGVLFHADAAEMLGDCGESEAAAEHLRRGRSRADVAGREDLLVLATTLWEARYGDASAAAEAIAQLSPRPRERWRYALVRAWCAHRLGDDTQARELAAAAIAEAEVLGHPETVAVVEPELAAWAAALLGEQAGGAPVRTGQGAQVDVVLLGPVALHRDGTDATPPPGHPTELVALLALRGPTSAESVTEAMWPEADTATSKRRLRNLLHRLRSACGDIVVRDRDDRLALARHVEVDLTRLRAAVDAVNAAPAPERAGAARAALRLTDTLAAPAGQGAVRACREEGARLALVLLDLVVEAAVEADDLDDAATLAARACALDPGDERRLLLLASIRRDAGRLPAAREALTASLQRCTQLGVEPSVAHRALARSLGVTLPD